MSRRARARGALLAAALWLACATPASRGPEPAAPDVPRSPARLVLVSVSGLAAVEYRAAAPTMPWLAARAVLGVAADAVLPVAPASRYPAHATLVTGLLPRAHGIVADRRLGESGVRGESYSHASLLRGATLWHAAREAGLRVASLGWPTTLGAEIEQSLPDVEPTRGASWLDALTGSAAPELLEQARLAGGAAPDARAPGPARDAVLVSVGCELVASPQPPQLLLVALAGPRSALRSSGPGSQEARAAFAAADAQLARLFGCVRRSGRLASTAFVVAGDHGALPAHSAVAPNAALAAAGLLTPQPSGTGLLSWRAVARSNGGSAFVYARGERDAVLARRALADAAARTRAFRIVSAERMLALGADPDAWFGLEAEPGYLFSDLATGPDVRASGVRGGWGYLPTEPAMRAGLVAFGAGFGRGVRVPEMHQADVAPTLAHLLGLGLDAGAGRALVGVLRLPQVSAGAPR